MFFSGSSTEPALIPASDQPQEKKPDGVTVSMRMMDHVVGMLASKDVEALIGELLCPRAKREIAHGWKCTLLGIAQNDVLLALSLAPSAFVILVFMFLYPFELIESSTNTGEATGQQSTTSRTRTSQSVRSRGRWAFHPGASMSRRQRQQTATTALTTL